MSEVKSTLSTVRDKIRDGLTKLNREAKDKAEGKATQHDELDMDKEFDSAPHPGERLSAMDDDVIDDGIIIENELEQPKPKKKGLDTKQKILVVVAAVAVALWYTKNQGPAPSIETPAGEEHRLEGFKSGGEGDSAAVPGPAFNLADSSQNSHEPIPVSSAGAGEDALGFGSGGVKDAANDPIGTDALTADMNEQFGTPVEESSEVLDPFTGKVKAVPAHPTDLPLKEPHDALPPAMPAAGALAMPGTPADSPFAMGGSNSPELSGTKNQNPDSKKSVLQDQSANADVTGLKAQAAEKDSRIGSLESEVSKLKTDLAAAKHDLEQAKRNPAKSSPSKAAQHKPVHAAHTNQRSTPSQRVASAPKAVPRPQICVTAVAQAARNCTTCVPHAFITHRGAETMVGQGDFLDGLRVNIVGDRLDLQNANGDVVHKFWSSPNGCAAG